MDCRCFHRFHVNIQVVAISAAFTIIDTISYFVSMTPSSIHTEPGETDMIIVASSDMAAAVTDVSSFYNAEQT